MWPWSDRELTGDLLAITMREAQITAQLEHPNIPAVHSIAVDEDGRPYFTMIRLQGRTLAQVLGEERPSTNRCLTLMQQIASAVAFAHNRGVIHRAQHDRQECSKHNNG